jgi:type III restriction enzyme
MYIYQVLRNRVEEWRKQAYPHAGYPTIGEILEHAANPEGSGFHLRAPQVHALETYWYLRLVEKTPHIFDLYCRYFPPENDPDALLQASGIRPEAFQKSRYSFNRLWDNIKADAACRAPRRPPCAPGPQPPTGSHAGINRDS